MRDLLMICAAAALLSGCAQRGPSVAVQGPALPAAKSFLITQDRPATGAEPAIAAALTGAGLSAAAPEQKPDYLVEVGYADRPAKMGAYLPGATPADPPAGWLETPPKSSPLNLFRKGARSLTVAVIDTSTGASVRKVAVSEYYRRANPQAASRLGATAAEALKTP